MLLGLSGSIAMQQTESDGRKSLRPDQEAPPLVVFQIPPPTEPSHMVLGLVGWTMMERVRPPTLPGPSQVQGGESVAPSVPLPLPGRPLARTPRLAAAKLAIIASRCALARISALAGTVPL